MKCCGCLSEFTIVVDSAVDNLCPPCSLDALGIIRPKMWLSDRIPVALQYDIEEYCEGFDGPCLATEAELRPAMTAYEWDGTGDDPNRSIMLCDECATAYHDHWQSMWDEYYRGLL